MKKRIIFKYNKYSPWLLYVMLIVGVTLGLLAYYLFLVVSGINQGPYGGPEYFRNHTNHALLVIFGLIPVAMLVPTFISLKIWGAKDEEGRVDLYDDHLVLYWKDEEIHIKRGELKIELPRPQALCYTTYILKVPGRRIVLVASLNERKRGSVKSTLEKALQDLANSF